MCFPHWGWLSELCPLADSQDDSLAHSGRFFFFTLSQQKYSEQCVFTASAVKCCCNSNLLCNLLDLVGQRKDSVYQRWQIESITFSVPEGKLSSHWWSKVVFSCCCFVTTLVFWNFMIRLWKKQSSYASSCALSLGMKKWNQLLEERNVIAAADE